VTDASAREDCAQFGRLYRMAAHYGEPKPDEFCSMVVKMHDDNITVDPRVAEHRVCMASLPKILQYPNVTQSTKASCLALKPKLPEIELACGRYAAELGNAVSLGLLDEARLCDRVLTGGFTSGFDQDHFVYSCEQYAANLAKRRQDGEGPRELGIEAKKSCDSHVPPIDKPFCMEYTRLAVQSGEDVNRTKFAEICEAQYIKMQNPRYGKAAPKNDAAVPKNESQPESLEEQPANETEAPPIVEEPEPLPGSEAPATVTADAEPPSDTAPATEVKAEHVESSKPRPHGAYVGAGAEDKPIRVLLNNHHKHRRVNKVSQQALDGLVKANAATRRQGKHRVQASSATPVTAQQSHSHKEKKSSSYMKYLKAWTHPDEPEHKVQSLVSKTSTVESSDASEMQDQDVSGVDSDEGAEAGILKGFLAQDGSLAGATAEKTVTRVSVSDGDDPSEAVEEADDSSKSASDDQNSAPKVKQASDERDDGSTLLAEVTADTSEGSSNTQPAESGPAPSADESKDDSSGVDDMVQSFLKNNS